MNGLAFAAIRVYQHTLSKRLGGPGFRCHHEPDLLRVRGARVSKDGFREAAHLSIERIRACGEPCGRPFVDFPSEPRVEAYQVIPVNPPVMEGGGAIRYLPRMMIHAGARPFTPRSSS